MRIALLLSCAALPAFAQLASHPDAPIRIGHYHLNVTSVEAHKKFWAGTLGGKAMKFGAGPSGRATRKFGGIARMHRPGAVLSLRLRAPAGPTRCTAFDPNGFA